MSQALDFSMFSVKQKEAYDKMADGNKNKYYNLVSKSYITKQKKKEQKLLEPQVFKEKPVKEKPLTKKELKAQIQQLQSKILCTDSQVIRPVTIEPPKQLESQEQVVAPQVTPVKKTRAPKKDTLALKVDKIEQLIQQLTSQQKDTIKEEASNEQQL